MTISAIRGRARAFDTLVSGQDFNGELAERYGYVNRAIPDEQFVELVDAFAQRVSRFDLLALADIKRFVNAATLPADTRERFHQRKTGITSNNETLKCHSQNFMSWKVDTTSVASAACRRPCRMR